MNKKINEFWGYLEIVKKRKWLILLPTFFCVLATGIYSFLATPVWRIDCIFQPSRIYLETSGGSLQEIINPDPRQITGQIAREIYNEPIARELKLDIKKFPKIAAETIRDTSLIQLSLKHTDIEVAKAILFSLTSRLKKEFDGRAQIERNGLDTRIALNDNLKAQKELQTQELAYSIKMKDNEIRIRQKDILSLEIEKMKKEQARASAMAKIKISEEWVTSLSQERESVSKRMAGFEKALMDAQAEKKEAAQTVNLFLFANEVQQNLQYRTSLDEKMNAEKVARENLRLVFQTLEKESNQIDAQIGRIRTDIDTLTTQIADIKVGATRVLHEMKSLDYENELLRTRKARMDFAHLIKEPGPSLYPVAPRKKLNILLAGLLSLTAFSVLAFFLETLRKPIAP